MHVCVCIIYIVCVCVRVPDSRFKLNSSRRYNNTIPLVSVI